MTKAIRLLKKTSLLGTGTFLCVIHTDKIPPHIGLLVEGNFFSLKFNGKDYELHFSKLLKVVDGKKIPCLFYHLQSIPVDEVKRVFESAPNKIGVGETCLGPINQVISGKNEFQIVTELIDYLSVNKLIFDVYGIHLPDGFTSIRNYSREDVDQRILSLKNDKRG